MVHASLDLMLDGERGVWHLANRGRVTWADLARQAADLAGVAADALWPRPTHELGLLAARPLFSVLESERGWVMPTLDDALARFCTER